MAVRTDAEHHQVEQSRPVVGQLSGVLRDSAVQEPATIAGGDLVDVPRGHEQRCEHGLARLACVALGALRGHEALITPPEVDPLPIDLGDLGSGVTSGYLVVDRVRDGSARQRQMRRDPGVLESREVGKQAIGDLLGERRRVREHFDARPAHCLLAR